MSTVRAKMNCWAKTPLQTSDPKSTCVEVRFMPVYSDSPENAAWSKATPQGELRLVITNPAAIDAFDLGKEYFVDFTPA
jgi:hypothetical protein